MKPILSINNIYKSFADTYTGISGKKETSWSQVLNGVDFSLNKGSVTALIGGNGSGKSTLFNIISGLIPATKGNVIYYNNSRSYDLSKLSSHHHARIGITRLFQGSNVFRNLSVLENMLIADSNRMGEQPWHILFKARTIKKQEYLRTDEAITILNGLLGKNNSLWKKRNDPCGTLSIGQQRLLAFARLFMNKNATLYLLDEPCAGVNAEIRETMAHMISNLEKEKKTVLLVEHNMDFAKQTAKNAYYLEEGQIVLKGEIESVLQNPLVQQNYLGIEHRL